MPYEDDRNYPDYEANGFSNRRAYLAHLAESYPPEAVYALADVLGPMEDFDGLITSLKDL